MLNPISFVYSPKFNIEHRRSSGCLDLENCVSCSTGSHVSTNPTDYVVVVCLGLDSVVS